MNLNRRYGMLLQHLRASRISPLRISRCVSNKSSRIGLICHVNLILLRAIAYVQSEIENYWVYKVIR